MGKTTGFLDTILKGVIAVSSAVLGVFGANAMNY